MKSIQKLTILFIIGLFLLAACNLGNPDPTTAQETAVAATLAARNGGSVDPVSGSGNPSGPDTTSPSISDVNALSDPVYYGNNTCGPTSLTIQAKISDNVGVAKTYLRYRYSETGGSGNWREAFLTSGGGSVYSVSVNIASEANSELNGANGVLEYQVFAEDAQVNWTSSPQGAGVKTVQIENCTQQAVQNSSDTQAPKISNVASSANSVFYPDTTCGPTSVNISASVSDNSGSVSSVTVNYRFLDYNTGAGGNQWFSQTMSGSNGNYSANVNIATDANTELAGNDGVMEYQVFAEDGAGNSVTEPDGFVLGVTVQNCSPQVGNPPPGGSSSQIDISNVYVSTYGVYYGNCTNSETTQVHVEASITPLSDINTVNLVYWYSDNNGVNGSVFTTMYQLGVGDYAGDIDVGTTAPNDISGDGWVDFYIEVEDIYGQWWYSSTYSANVYECSSGGGNSGGGSGSASPLSFSNSTQSPSSAYFGSCSNETTQIEVSVDITPISDVDTSSVTITYQYGDNNSGSTTNWFQQFMSAAGGNRFRYYFDTTNGQIPDSFSNSAYIIYYVSGKNTDGTYYEESTTHSIHLDKCSSGGGVGSAITTVTLPIYSTGFFDFPNNNFWSGQILVGNDQYNQTLEGHAEWDLSGIPSSATVTAATVYFDNCVEVGSVSGLWNLGFSGPGQFGWDHIAWIWCVNAPIDLTSNFQYLTLGSGTFAIRIYFDNASWTANDNQDDYYIIPPPTLIVTYEN